MSFDGINRGAVADPAARANPHLLSASLKLGFSLFLLGDRASDILGNIITKLHWTI